MSSNSKVIVKTPYHEGYKENNYHLGELEKDMDNSTRQHWEMIETFYVSRLGSLHKEIEKMTIEDHKIRQSRDELLKEVVRLSQKSTELSLKNEALTRIIAEKENKITAFMYEEENMATEPPSHVVLSDPVKENNTLEVKLKKETSLFRRISSRLSIKKSRQQEVPDYVSPFNGVKEDASPVENNEQKRKKRK